MLYNPFSERWRSCRQPRRRLPPAAPPSLTPPPPPSRPSQVHEGARIERARTAKGQEVGPRRAWPGGLAVARTLGDSDAGSYVLPQPALQAVTLPIGGAAVVICSDGVWDAVGVGDAAHMLQVR